MMKDRIDWVEEGGEVGVSSVNISWDRLSSRSS